MKYLNESSPISKSKGCTYTTEEVELKKKFVIHEGFNSFKLYAQFVLPNDKVIHNVTIEKILAFGKASLN